METRSVLFGLLILWGAVTTVLICVLAYRGRLESREEDQILVAKGEEAAAKDQHLLISAIQKLSRPITVLAAISGSLLVLSGGLWLWQAIKNF